MATNQEATDNKTSTNSKPAAKRNSKKKTAKRKRGTVVVPKMSNIMKPQGMSLVQWQIALRKQQAEKESFSITQTDEEFCPGEYHVKNAVTRNDYKVVYRGKDSQWNYCSCYDFKTSQLGTCKHLEAVRMWIRAKKKKIQREEPDYSSVYVDYKGPRCVKIRIGKDNYDTIRKLAHDYFDDNCVIREDAYTKFDVFLHAAKEIDANFRCYDDALDFIIEKREKAYRERLVQSKYQDDDMDKLLAVSLYQYQKEGIRFAVRAGKAIIADEMGLGKTVQAIASAEIFLREGLADSILIVCPTSLKYQWKKEIEKFTGGDQVKADEQQEDDGILSPKVVVIEGAPAKRQRLYKVRAPYKIVSYHTMCNDVRELGLLTTDVLVMDEIQRLKNWDTHISKAARKIESRYSVLLSGTPMENRLEELYANMELVDQFCLGPYYKFRDDHIILDPEQGSIVGYKNLNSIGSQIKEKLIRRTKKGVQLQLPKRNIQYTLVPMTDTQSDYHSEFKWEITKILNKYQKFHYMSEQDRKRLMLLLGQMRMVADSTFILDQNLKTRSDTKINEVMNLLATAFANGNDKVVIFSEWERMTRLVAIELEKRGIRYEYLHGKIPAKQRGQLVEQFTTLPESRVFISTDAGSTGLNLQVASILINLDLPWNPAVLEQRIARIFRLGQEKPVQIINLVSLGSIEEGMIDKLRFKSSMFEGVLDGGADTVFASEDKFKKFMDKVSSVIKDTQDSPVVEYVNEEAEEIPTASSASEISEEMSASRHGIESASYSETGNADVTENYTMEHGTTIPHTSNGNIQKNASHTPHSETNMHTAPKQLINQGISFFSNLCEVLKSPDATKQLIDSIVDVDKETGETNIKIPVASKDTVLQLLSIFGKLMQQ